MTNPNPKASIENITRKQMKKQLHEVIEFRESYLNGMEEFRDRYAKLDDYIRNAEKNHLMNYHEALTKINIAGRQAQKVFMALDKIGDIYQATERIFGSLPVTENADDTKEIKVPKEIWPGITANYKKILKKKPVIESMIAKLLLLVADAEKVLYGNKSRVIRR